jgi:hypothetical protein
LTSREGFNGHLTTQLLLLAERACVRDDDLGDDRKYRAEVVCVCVCMLALPHTIIF